MRLMNNRTLVVLALLLAGVAGGCSAKGGVALKASLQKDGKPVVLAEDEMVEVGLVGNDPDGKSFGSSANLTKENGTLTFHGPVGKGIPPGTYKVTLRSRAGMGPKMQVDRFRDFALDKTPLSYTVTAGSPQEIVIDIGKKTVVKK